MMRCGLILILFLPLIAIGQAFETGLALEKKFQDEAALVQFEKALAKNPNHGPALTHASRMLSNLAGRMPHTQKAQKAAYLNKAHAYAERAIKQLPHDAQAHLARVVSLGLQSEIVSGPSEKVRLAKEVYDEAKTMLRLDSALAVAHFVMGKWHFELARLNMVERIACDIFFGGMPEQASMDRALMHFKKASSLEPNTILYLFGEARVYHYLDEEKKAIATLSGALALPNREPDDDIRKEKCRALLKEIQD